MFSPALSQQPSRKLVGALLIFLGLSVAMTFPMILRMTDAVPGFEGDNLFFVWEIWWVKHALVDLQTSPLFSTSVYYPFGYELARDELTPSNTFLALPLATAFGPVFGYNAMMLLSFVLSGFGAYLWILRLTRRHSAALVSGVAFAFLPYRFAHFHGHLNLMATQWLPLALSAMDGVFERPTVQRGVVVGIFAGLVILSAWYYALFAVILLPLYFMCRWRTSGRRLFDATAWKSFLVAGIVMLALALPFAWPIYQVAAAESFTRALADKEVWALNPYDYLIPNRLSPWWSEAVVARFPHQSKLWIELGVSVSYLIVALAGVALLARRKRSVLLPLGMTLLVAYLISLGPTLHWNDQPVHVELPLAASAALNQSGIWDSLAQALGPKDMAIIQSDGGFAIPLPSLAIHLWMPFGNGVRSMDRAAVWTALMAVALAGVGFTVAWNGLAQRRVRRVWQVALCVVVVCVILAESYSTGAQSYTTLRPRAVDLWLAKQPADTVVLEYPPYGHILEYYGTVHQKSVIFGLDGVAFTPARQTARGRLVAEFPSSASVTALKEWQVTHILFTPRRIPQWDALRTQLSAFPELKLARVLDGVWVYQLSHE